MAFRIEVKEDGIEDSLYTIPVTKDTHGPGPSLYLPKRSFDEIGGTDRPPQGHLGFLKLLGIQSSFLLRRKLHLIERE